MFSRSKKLSMAVGLAAVFALLGTAVPANAYAGPIAVCPTHGRSTSTYIEVYIQVGPVTCSLVQAQMTRSYGGTILTYFGPAVNSGGYSRVEQTHGLGTNAGNYVRANYNNVWGSWKYVTPATVYVW